MYKTPVPRQGNSPATPQTCREGCQTDGISYAYSHAPVSTGFGTRSLLCLRRNLNPPPQGVRNLQVELFFQRRVFLSILDFDVFRSNFPYKMFFVNQTPTPDFKSLGLFWKDTFLLFHKFPSCLGKIN